MSNEPLNVSVVGLGKLGSPLAAALASKGHHVVGVDVMERNVALINEGKPPVAETGLAELLAANRERLRATTDMAEAIAATDLTLIIVPTPSGEDGTFSLAYLEPAIESIGKALATKDAFHVVVVTSTIMPGSMDGTVKPLIERVSGKRAGVDFGLSYNPEFIALGSVIRDLLHPDFILIGESDERTGEILADFYTGFCDNDPEIARMTFTNAELTKLAVNTFVTTKISYANMLTELCEHLDGANVDVVTAALGLDARIGPKYLKGGLGYGGPCFPRDNVALAALARSLGADATLPEATDTVNRAQVPRIVDVVEAHRTPGGRVGILGLSYKPQTDVVEQAQGLQLAEALLERGVPVAVYDPMAMDNARKTLDGDVVLAGTMEECLSSSQTIVVTTPWELFKNLDASLLDASTGRPAVVDCWRMYDRERIETTATYVPLGADMSAIRG